MPRPTRTVRAAALVAAALSLSGCASFAQAWEEGEARAEASASAAAPEQADSGIVIERADGQPIEPSAPSPAVLPFAPASEQEEIYDRRTGHLDYFKQAPDGSYRWCSILEVYGHEAGPVNHCEAMPKGWTPQDGYAEVKEPAEAPAP